MGKEIESLAIEKGHKVVLRIDEKEFSLFDSEEFKTADVAIEFSTPETAYNNIYKCIESNIPVVSGTTGWMNRFDEIKTYCQKKESSFFYASNFSIGVNIMFELNKKLASIMNKFEVYSVSLDETHHVNKIDAPSGTAVTLANEITGELDRVQSWVCNKPAKNDELSITAKRIGNVTGEHTIIYNSSVDSIELKHSAKSRKGFALGAIMAAEFIIDKTGVFGMNDLLDL